MSVGQWLPATVGAPGDVGAPVEGAVRCVYADGASKWVRREEVLGSLV